MMIDYNTLIDIGANFGAFVLVAWLVRYTFTYTIPRLANTFQATLTGLTTVFREEMQKFRDSAARDRDVYREDLRQERETIKELAKALDRNTDIIEKYQRQDA